MKLCNEAITIFNAQVDGTKGTNVYAPTIIRGVSWFCDIASNVDSSGLKAANRFTIRIPVDADFSGKSYVPPAVYATGDPATCFTIKNGDIIIKGEVAVQGMKPTDLRKSFDEYVTVLGVTDNRRAPNAPHWKVVGT